MPLCICIREPPCIAKSKETQKVRHAIRQTIMNEMSVFQVSGYLRFSTKASPLPRVLVFVILDDLE